MIFHCSLYGVAESEACLKYFDKQKANLSGEEKKNDGGEEGA